MDITVQHILGALITVVLFIVLGILSGRKVKTSEDFSVAGKRAGGVLVAGTILGTMIGGASTIGTAQMAYAKGVSAWWFTLGGGISCLIFCLFFTKPFRMNKHVTIPRIIQEAYGEKAALAATFFISFGMIVNIIPQVISASALISSFFSLSISIAAVSAVLLMITYVFFGGVWGTGILGTMKTVLTSLSLLAGGLLVLWYFGGPAGMTASLPHFPWFSFFGNDAGDDIAALSSLLIGVLTGQIYLQAIVGAKSLRSSREGTLISAVLGPIIGLGGVFIGLFMRVHHPDIVAVQALPLFIIRYLPAWLAGVVLATLLFAAIGTGAGLALGICTILNRDIYQKLCPDAEDKKVLGMFRTLIIILFALALTVVLLTGGNAMILDWSYLSHGFRGVSAFLPMVTALFLRGKIHKGAGIWAAFLPPVIVIFWIVFKPWPIEPLFPGLFTSFVLFVGGFIKNRRQTDLHTAGTPQD